MIPPVTPAFPAYPSEVAFLSGGGEMGRLIGEKDWSQTVLGPPAGWPQSLRTTLSILLTAKLPMFLYWGPELTCFYNDAFRPSLGDDGKHPGSLGKPGSAFWPEAWPAIYPVIEGVLAGGEATWREDQLVPIHRNGKREDGYWTYSFSPVRDESGGIAGVLVLCQDVTAQVSRKQLEASEAKLRSIIAAAPAGIGLFMGRDLVIEMPNQTLVDFIGKGWGIVGKPLREAMPELTTEGQPFLRILDEVYTTGQMYETYGSQVKILRDGVMTNNYYNITYTPLLDADGQVYAILEIAVDVTGETEARQRLEESERQAQALAQELAASNEELRAANEEIRSSNEELGVTNAQLTRINSDLDNFVYTASHDLKAPISNIEGLMQALLRQLPAESLAPERVQRIVNLIQDSVERFKKTITNLTEIVKLQKEHNREAVLVDLPQIVGEVMLDLEASIQSVGARVAVDVAACPPVRFSEKNLRSVVYNLVSNALKYRSPDRVPEVRVWCESTPAFHILTVADNGLGIEAERLSQLFTMFRRFHDHVEGTGIGLFMVKKMVENAGGKITVESRVGEGSTFRVYLPG